MDGPRGKLVVMRWRTHAPLSSDGCLWHGASVTVARLLAETKDERSSLPHACLSRAHPRAIDCRPCARQSIWVRNSPRLCAELNVGQPVTHMAPARPRVNYDYPTRVRRNAVAHPVALRGGWAASFRAFWRVRPGAMDRGSLPQSPTPYTEGRIRDFIFREPS